MAGGPGHSRHEEHRDDGQLGRGRPPHHAGAGAEADEGNQAEHAHGREGRWGEESGGAPDSREQVLREADAERGRQAGVDHEQRHPAVDECGARSEGLSEEHVSAASLREARRQLRIAQGARRAQRAHDRPHRESRPRVAKGPHHRRRREEDADAHDLRHDHRRGRLGAEPAWNGRVLRPARRTQNVTLAASCIARGPPDPNTPPAVLTAWPNRLACRKPGLAGSSESRTSTFEKPE
jgi:hypothetical protein